MPDSFIFSGTCVRWERGFALPGRYSPEGMSSDLCFMHTHGSYHEHYGKHEVSEP